jgi:hypothetical protein
MNREDLFGLLLLIGFSVFLVIFVIWAIQQYRIQRELAEQELESMRRTQYAIAQLYKSGAMKDGEQKKNKRNKGKEGAEQAESVEVDEATQRAFEEELKKRQIEENFEDSQGAEPGAKLPDAFMKAMTEGTVSPSGKKLMYEYPDASLEFSFGEKGNMEMEVDADVLKIQPPPKCENVSNQYIYQLNQKIMKQNQMAEEMNRQAAAMNRQSRDNLRNVPEWSQKQKKASRTIRSFEPMPEGGEMKAKTESRPAPAHTNQDTRELLI